MKRSSIGALICFAVIALFAFDHSSLVGLHRPRDKGLCAVTTSQIEKGKKMVCTRSPPATDMPLPQLWRQGAPPLEPQNAPRMTDKELYEHLYASSARLPPPGACVSEQAPSARCRTAIEEVRKRVDRMMRCKPLVNLAHYPGSRDTVDAQLAHLPEMAMGTFNTPCPHLRSRSSFNLTHNSPEDKAVRDRLRRCKIPPVSASCVRQPNGLIVCTFQPEKPPAYA